MPRHNLTTDQLSRLIALVVDEHSRVESGQVVGYGQPKEDELADLDELLDDLQNVRGYYGA